MTDFEPTPLDDALSLLEYEEWTWVVFKAHVFLPYEGVPSTAYGVWNFIFDVFVFWVEHEGPDCMIVSEGSIEESDWSVYRAEQKLTYWFLRRYRQCKEIEVKIAKMDADLC